MDTRDKMVGEFLIGVDMGNKSLDERVGDLEKTVELLCARCDYLWDNFLNREDKSVDEMVEMRLSNLERGIKFIKHCIE